MCVCVCVCVCVFLFLCFPFSYAHIRLYIIYICFLFNVICFSYIFIGAWPRYNLFLHPRLSIRRELVPASFNFAWLVLASFFNTLPLPFFRLQPVLYTALCRGCGRSGSTAFCKQRTPWTKASYCVCMGARWDSSIFNFDVAVVLYTIYIYSISCFFVCFIRWYDFVYQALFPMPIYSESFPVRLTLPFSAPFCSIEGNFMSDVGLYSLANALPTNTQLRALGYATKARWAGPRSLLLSPSVIHVSFSSPFRLHAWVAHLPSSVCNNYLTDSGVWALADALAHNTTLHTLE